MDPNDPVLFLDIDGVLNGHEYNEEAQSNGIRADCVQRLNRVLGMTDCSIVLSSAWRYMVLRGAMTLQGFSYMLRTHGVRSPMRLIGCFGEDDQTEDPDERARQVLAWRAEHEHTGRWAVVDDMDLGFLGMPFVQTDKTKGLTDEDADRLIKFLKGRP